jgi:nucleoside-diphosphate-sugar epimerase
MSMTLDFEGIFNVGREDAAVSMRRVAEIACDLTGASYDLIQEIDAPANQTVVKRLSTKKIRGIGWEPEVELEEGMRNTLEWLRSMSSDSEEAAVRS